MYKNNLLLTCIGLIIISPLWTISADSEGSFCYGENDVCGPSTWPQLCQTGTRQSPIDLPYIRRASGMIRLNLQVYRGNSFRIQNNGHTVNVDFNNQSPSNQILTFTDPLNSQVKRQYKFAAAHFHWGTSDTDLGSEHCIAGTCSVMELHFVHYLANYSGPTEALNSGDESALSVIGVLLDVSSQSSGALLPIVKNLQSIEEPSHDANQWTTVNQTLDFGKLLSSSSSDVYTYKGSLTTPGCNEQVNWYMLKNPAKISKQESEPFRTMIKDDEGMTLTENHRPIQSINGRKVFLSRVLSY